MALTTAAVVFIACHGGPADHFATFKNHLPNEAIQIFASGPGLNKFKERGVEVKKEFSLDKISPEDEDALAIELAKACASASVVITDVGHPFSLKVQKALAQYQVHVLRLAYYDNPESYVPGGYSTVAKEVMLAAQGVLFANSNLAKEPVCSERNKAIDFGTRKRIGIGYYPKEQAAKIQDQRTKEKTGLREKLLNGLDKDRKVLVYFGGNNEEYFKKAFPAFLNLLEKGMQTSDFSNFLLVMQQHPGAKKENIDGNLLSSWLKPLEKNRHLPKVIISNFSSDAAQVIADGALYYQTSMSPQYALEGLPTLQIGHETYPDILVENHLCLSVTKEDRLKEIFEEFTNKKTEIPKERILDALGFQADWLDNLRKAIFLKI